MYLKSELVLLVVMAGPVYLKKELICDWSSDYCKMYEKHY